MSLEIVVSGQDITDDVLIADARFTMANGPNPGDFEFGVKDAAKTYDFRAGQPIEVDFDGVRVFEGYVLVASQRHGFPVDDSVTEGPGPVERLWTLKGVDLNVLFRKRVVFDQADPSDRISLDLAAGTSDLTYLNAIVDHLTLDDDNLTLDFNAVGSPNPDRSGVAISIGDSWERVMSLTAEIPGAIWGIRPPRTVYYEDDDTETAPFAISDVPDNVTSFGYSNFEWLNDGSRLVNDARIWGVGLGQDRLTFDHVSDAASIAEHGRWQNGNGWRFDLYRQTSVSLVTNSLVYGSPQNLHGPKDDSMVVTCRIKRPGIMPGHKVRIISEIFGEEIVLPVRRYTITFVDHDTALFDLEMTWDIDAPRSLFDRPPYTLPKADIPEITVPDPCDDLGFAFGIMDSTLGWETVRSHPWLGSASFIGSNLASAFHFRPKKRYNQTWGSIFISDRGDGIAGGLTYVHARHYIVPPSRWVLQMEFEVPTYSFIPGYHLPPLPKFEANIWWGAGDLTVYPDISLDIEVFGVSHRLIDVADGINRVAAAGYNTLHQAQGSKWKYELYYNGQSRCWPAGGVRPSTSVSIPSQDAPGISHEPFDQATYGPNRPWRVAGTPDSYERDNYIYIRAQAGGHNGSKSFHPQTVTGSPITANNTIRTNFERFTTGATVSGETTGYHDDLADGYAASIPITNFRFVTLPDDFNFATEVPVDCAELTPMPVAGATNCELIFKTSNTEYVTTWPFAQGSTVVSLEGTEQRLGIDYDEDVPNQKIVFRDPVGSSAGLYVCYQVVS